MRMYAPSFGGVRRRALYDGTSAAVVVEAVVVVVVEGRSVSEMLMPAGGVLRAMSSS